MGRGGGAARVGCAAFSLLGLLVGVGLTAWLSSRVLDSSTDAPRRDTDGQTTQPADAIDPGVEVSVEPATGLAEGQAVHVTSTAFPAGASVTVRQCLTPTTGTGLVLGDGSTCDPEVEPVTATVGTDGTLSADLAVHVVVVSGDLPFDCADEPARCSVIVSTAAADDPVAGAVPLAFAPGTRPEITLPGG